MSVRKSFWFVVLVCLWSVAFAGGSVHHNGGSSSSNQSNVQAQGQQQSQSAASVAVSNAQGGTAQQSQSNSNTVTSSGGAGGQGGAGGSSNQSQSANNEGNSFSTVSNYRDRLQAPSISAPAVYASGPCESGKSAGIAVPGFGVSGGKSVANANCDRREVARVLMGINPALALKVLCADPYVAAVAKPEDCVYVEKQEVINRQPADSSVTADDPKYVTHEELNRAFKQSQAK